MSEWEKQSNLEENPESSAKRKLPSDESFPESESQPVDKKSKLSSTNKEVAENELTCESEQVVSNEENNLSQDKDDANTSSNVKPPRRRFEPECKPCRKRFYCAKTYFLHMESQGHKKKERKREILQCKLCDKTFQGRSFYDKHVVSKKHQKKLYNHHLIEKFNVDRSTLPTKEEASAKKGPIFSFFCQICNKKFSDLISYDLHMSSPSHSRVVKEATLEKIASCAICSLSFSGLTSYETHMSSALHMKNVQQARNSSYGTQPFNNFTVYNN